MNEQEKQEYLERYKVAKEKGVPFFPDILFKDAVVVLFIFLILAALAYFLGAPLEARADPADTNYTPRPEWYFLFLFQLLKYFPGSLEFLGVVVLPTWLFSVYFYYPSWTEIQNATIVIRL
jgi:quinol-cytochrome oxidoreductase complex cytochrome b subunit